MLRSLFALCCLTLFAGRASAQFSPADTCTQPTFFNYYAASDTTLSGATLCRSADGSLYLGASKAGGGLVFMKLSPAGQLLWSRTFSLQPLTEYALAEIFEDSDGKLVACGTAGSDTLAHCFLLRYDPVQNALLWVKVLEEVNAYANGIVEATPGGHYLLNIRVRNFLDVDNGSITRINRNTGEPVGAGPGSNPFVYNYGIYNTTAFNSMTMRQGVVYTVGHYTDVPGNTPAALEKTRCVVGRFNPFVAAPDWARVTHVDTNQTNPVYGRDLLIDHDTLVTLSYAQDSLPLSDYNYFFLQKFTLQGDLLWAKRYYIPIAFTETVHDLVATPDGYVLYGNYTRSSILADFILKLDKAGNIQWAKYIDLTVPDAVTGRGMRQNTALAVGSSVYLTGLGGADPLVKDLFVLKINGEGPVSDQCGYLRPLKVLTAPVLDPISEHAGIPAYSAPTPYTSRQGTTTNSPVSTATQCTRCAEVAPDCAHLPDLSVSIDSVFCIDGNFGFTYTICNEGDTTDFRGYIDLIYFYGNPFTHNDPWRWRGSQSINNTQWINGGCSTRTVNNLNQSFFAVTGLPDSIFIVVNMKPSAPLPYSLDTFVTNGIVECNYHNNVAFMVPFALDLGPDRSVCAGDSVLLQNLLTQTNPGLVTYLWQDSSTNATFTASGPGLYWVEATNDCGLTRRDTVLIAPASVTDTVDLAFCPGDFVVVNNQTYTQPDTVEVTIPATSGCDTLRVYQLRFLAQPVVNQEITFCPGASVTIDGTVYTQPGTVTDTLAATTGCDTLVIYSLQYTPPQASQLTLTCPADQAVQTASGQGTIVVSYAAPAAVTDCPCDSIPIQLAQGLASGAAFPVGVHTVCYSAADYCGSTAACCFTVMVTAATSPDTACDLKTSGCLQYELLNIYTDAGQNRTYRIRVKNNCSSPMLYTAIQLPDGVVATAPSDHSMYTTAGGHTYSVRNPNAAPFYSIRFKSLSDSIVNGASDIFEYTLPAQATPAYIHVLARLASQVAYEAYLNVYSCPVEPRQQGERLFSTDWRVYPNPTTGSLRIELPAGADGRQLELYDALGKRVMRETIGAEEGVLDWNLEGLSRGIYYLRLVGEMRKIVVQP